MPSLMLHICMKASAYSTVTREALSAAIVAYEEELVPRGRNAVEVNNLNTVAIHNWSTVLESPIIKFGSRPDAAVGSKTAI